MTQSISIQHILQNQLQIPIQLISNYKELGLSETEVMVILQIHRFSHGNNDFPTPEELSSYLTINEKECSEILRKLIQKNLMNINQTENQKNQLCESYCLNPLWQKLFHIEDSSEDSEYNIGTIFILFEQEFGRPLSPFEIEMVNAWLDEDEISPALIKAGLRESVLMGKLNFTYIDRILRDWKKKGISSVDEARESSRAFRERQSRKQVQPKQSTNKVDQSLYYNWLEGGD